MRELRRRLGAEQSLPSFDPCLPRSADQPPAGPGWIHEIKHDGFRILAHRRGRSVRLITGGPLSPRRGGDRGLARSILRRRRRGHRLRRQRTCRIRSHPWAWHQCTRHPLCVRSARSERRGHQAGADRGPQALRLPHDGIALNEHFGGDGAVIYKHAYALGCEGIVSKRLGAPYRAGRSAHWPKIGNPDAPAVRRLEEEDWT
jgi:bifunctional non-homologous end joining protein LigD